MPKVVSREKFILARKRFLAKEKKFTRARDALAAERRKLPRLRVDKAYLFDTPDGRETLADLFDGRSQLIVYHFMFAPDWDAGCPGCSHWADSFDGVVVHLAHNDVTMIACSRAPLAKLEAYKKRMGWSFKWVSSDNGDFNYDFQASFRPDDVKKKRAFFNYEWQDPWTTDREGLSVFYKDRKGRIFLTYSTHARGIDAMSADYQYLDVTPKGRNEGARGPYWVRRHDEYGD